jgi:uncharacterized protein YjbJ (UPF0337 family)
LIEALDILWSASIELTRIDIHRGGLMNKDQIKGIIDEVAGTAKRKVGKLTDNPKLQVEGMVQQAKGKAEGTWGKATGDVQHAIENTEAHLDAHVKSHSKNATLNSEHKN